MLKNKRLIYIGFFELPDKNAAAHRVLNNAKIFRKLGYDVTFIDLDRSQEDLILKKQNCFEFERYSVSEAPVRYFSIKNIKAILMQDDIDVIIAYNYPSIALIQLFNFCKRRHIKLLADVTEWYDTPKGNILYGFIKKIDTCFRMRIIHPRCAGVIAISEYLFDCYKKKTKTVQVPPLVDLSESIWNKECAYSKNDVISIVYAGQPGRDKDKLNIILHALEFCDLKKINFMIIGITKEQYIEYYPEDADLVDRLKDSVFFKGRKPHNDVIQILTSSDFSLFYRNVTRTTMAGFPTKFVESMTCGTPVITNRTSNLTNYLVDGVNGFWVDDIVNDLQRILSMDAVELRKLKCNINKETFDYRKYMEAVRIWLGSILQEN